MRDSTVMDDFIGRTEELDALEGMFTPVTAQSGEPPRLLTLTGVGGSGKTRLAHQFSEKIQGEFADGTTWVDLAPLSDPELVPRAILTALDLTEQADQSPLETLVAQLTLKQILLTLDNCEHLLASVSPLCQTLLSHCPELTILATSREPLGIVGESVYPVLPLSLPSEVEMEAVLRSDAVRLFVARARQVLPSFTLTPSNVSAVVRVCTRLDGLPLAIELAAARVKIMTVSEIAERLNDAFQLLTRRASLAPPRHQTLRAAMDWSYDLLSESEKALLRRISIFLGGFTLEAAEQICGEDGKDTPSDWLVVRRTAILDLLSNLADKSLVIIGDHNEGSPTRYRTLEIVRQYAAEKLAVAGEQELLRSRHLGWCVEFVERVEPELMGAGQGLWLAELDRERFNVYAALRYACDAGRVQAGLRIANALIRYWGIRGDYSGAVEWYQKLLGMDLAHVAAGVHARALYGLAAFHYRQGALEKAMAVGESGFALTERLADRSSMATLLNLLGGISADRSNFARALEFHEQALALRRELGDTWGVAASLHNLGYVAQQQGQYRRSFEYSERSLELKRQVRDRAAVALTLNSMGDVAISLTEYERAQAFLDEGLAIHRGLGDKQGVVYDLTNLAELAYHRGEYDKARALYQEAESLAQELMSKGDTAIILLGLGKITHAHGDPTRAHTLYEQALLLFRQVGKQVGIALVLHNLAATSAEGGDSARAAEMELAALRLYQELDHKPGMALALEGFAGICVEQMQADNATQFLGAALRLREEAGAPWHPSERLGLEQVSRKAQTALGESRFRAGMQRGREAPLSETIAIALTMSPQPLSLDLERPARPNLEVFGLGQSLVRRNGEPIRSAEWVYAKAKELFFYLLAHGRASREQIGLDLWADASPLQLRRIFHRVLHALRKALGDGEWITYQEDAYVLQRAGGYIYDVELFEAQVADARRTLRDDTGAQTQAIATLRSAVELYQGDFLADLMGGDWIFFRREELRKEFLQALLLLGQLLSEQKQYTQAIAVYEKALAQDNYLEVVHRELIRVQVRRGDVARAHKQYQMLVDLLQVEFGVPPAPETQALYDQLSRGENI